jgi:hypothetical protein
MGLDHEETDGVHWIRVPIDAITAARLAHLARIVEAEPISIAASLLHDILKDDESAHELSGRAVTFN